MEKVADPLPRFEVALPVVGRDQRDYLVLPNSSHGSDDPPLVPWKRLRVKGRADQGKGIGDY